MAETEEAARLKALSKLLTELREVQARTYAITEEAITLAAGGELWATTQKELTVFWDTLWCARYAPGQQKKYVWAGVRDFPSMKRLAMKLGKEDLKRRMVNYLKNDEDYYRRSKHSFAVFVASINSHADKAAPAPDPETPWSPIARQVEALVNRHTYYQWFKDLVFFSESETDIVVKAKSQLHADWLKKHHWTHILDAKDRAGELRAVRIIV